MYISIFYAFYVVPLKNEKSDFILLAQNNVVVTPSSIVLHATMKNRGERGNEKADDAAVDGDAGGDNADDHHDKKKWISSLKANESLWNLNVPTIPSVL